jgi:hypothetical protein
MAENADDPDDKVASLKLADAWLHMLPQPPTASAQSLDGARPPVKTPKLPLIRVRALVIYLDACDHQEGHVGLTVRP